ncbi:hypothetical protein M1116_00070 [Patescibacteria group bacterium]|nr:hypothetical protein [Patescibacteria group bacterium]
MANNSRKSSFLKPLIIAASVPLILLGLKTANDIRKGAAGVPAAITIDAVTSHGTSFTNLWQNLAQGGEEATDMIGPVANLVRPLQPKLIRVDHLYDYYQVYVGPNSYDFTRLDKVVDSILSTGARPLLSLSYTPSNLATDNKVANPPNDWTNWNNLVAATARHYSVDKGIGGIYYEVWNEPDLFGSWKSADYNNLYLNTARAVVAGAGSAAFKIGGPATTAFYPNWLRSLLQTVQDNHLPLNFISWHRYSKNIADYQRDLDQLNDVLADYPRFFGVERLLTEVGPNSEPDVWYDNQISGVHLISLVTALSGKIHRIFPFEVVDGPPNVRNGSTGWGLITNPQNGAKPKPRYFAIRFLNQLQGQLLGVNGNGTWVSSLATKKDDGTVDILLVNYDPRNTHTETFPVKIIGLNPGHYTFKRTDYLGNTSSRSITVTTYLYQDTFYLDPNTATLLELIPTQ